MPKAKTKKFTSDEVANKILETLSKQHFADWYSSDGAFDNYLTGWGEPAPTKEQILTDIKKKFGLE
jgi:hypothetical protein